MDELALHDTFAPTNLSALQLGSGEVHVWAVPLNGDAGKFEEVLSPAEQDRVRRFRFADHQRRFQICHGALRHILGAYTGAEARGLEFRHGPRGKPYLEGDGPAFNLSHSGKLALIGVAHTELGVDVEKVRRLESLSQIAQRHFADAEYSALSALADEERELAFYRCWTRKEAYIKALGEGLSMSLDSFEVSVEAEPKFLVCHDGREDPAAWSMLDVSPGPEFVGALAVRGLGVGVRRLRFEA